MPEFGTFVGAADKFSAVGMLLLLLWLLVTGRIRTRHDFEEARADRDAYRAAYERLREGEADRARAADEQTHEALRTLTHLVQAIPLGQGEGGRTT